MNITIVIPTFNERENIRQLLPRLMALPLEFQVLIVDDHSPDGTADLGREISENFPGRITVIERMDEHGFGSAYLRGFQEALNQGADVIGQMDADFSHQPEKLVDMERKLAEHDIVVGSRYVPGGSVDVNWPFWRKGLSAFANWYARTILRIPLNDVTGGYRLWKREILEKIPRNRIRSNGYVFLIELAYIASRLGCRFAEVPIYFAEREWGESKMSLKVAAEAGWRVWWLLWNYRDLKN